MVAIIQAHLEISSLNPLVWFVWLVVGRLVWLVGVLQKSPKHPESLWGIWVSTWFQDIHQDMCQDSVGTRIYHQWPVDMLLFLAIWPCHNHPKYPNGVLRSGIHEPYIHDESPVPNLTSLQIFLSSIFFLWTEDEYLFLGEEVIDSPLQPNPENF